jgi:hypothetical protein
VSNGAIRSQARRYAAVAVAVLRKIAQDGAERDGARAGASKALLDRGLGTVGKARMPDEQRDRPLGKKEEAAARRRGRRDRPLRHAGAAQQRH